MKRDGTAWNGGLNANDEIVQLNGAAPTDEAVKQALFASAPGTVVKMQVKHNAYLHDLSLTLQADPDRAYQIQPAASPTPDQQRLLAKWLGKREIPERHCERSAAMTDGLIFWLFAKKQSRARHHQPHQQRVAPEAALLGGA
ncbi:MAG: hypothetical protein WKG07_04655 [Hymenobacter sp.]